jgi:hypothetical protein
MKATLEFNLDDFDDRMSHFRCVMGINMALALWNIEMKLIDRVISRIKTDTISKEDLSEIIRTELNDMLSENEINLDQLIN